MKMGILVALAEGRLEDALRMLDQCKVTTPVETAYQYIATGLQDGDMRAGLTAEAIRSIQRADCREFEAAKTTGEICKS